MILFLGFELLLQHIICLKEQNKQILAILQSRPAEQVNLKLSRGFPIDSLENLLKFEQDELEAEAGVRDLVSLPYTFINSSIFFQSIIRL